MPNTFCGSKGLIIKSSRADDKCLPAKDSRKITTLLEQANDVRVSNALVEVFKHAEVGADLIKHLQRGKVYLAEIPRKLQKSFDDGHLQFMTIKETGQQVGEIVGPNNFGTKGHVIVKDAGVLHSNIPHDLTTIAFQQQLAQMAAVLDEVRARVVELQQTYDSSLLGELRGMRDQLTQVQDVRDLETQRDLIKQSISFINSTRGKIIQRLIDELKKIPGVPGTTIRRLLKTLLTEGFRGKVVTGYEKVQELFGFYLAASQMLAYAYALLGESKVYEDIFVPDDDLLSGTWLSNLERCEEIVGVYGEKWYSKPEKYLGYIKEKATAIFLDNQETIAIEATGEQLLEAIKYVQDE